MTDPDALLREGDVAGARAALVDIVRARPGDEQARMFLFQLLAVAGEWDKARNQLQSLASLSGEAAMLAAAYGQAIEAERVRTDVFAGRASMPLLSGHDGWATGLVTALGLLASGDVAAATAARDAAFDAVPDTPGRLNDTAFEWIADADARFGPACEAIIAGRYGLIPFDTVLKISSEGPRDLRDIVWYPVEIAFRSGQSVAAFLPTRYPGSEAATETAEMLARTTGWSARGWGDEGTGQHLLSLDGDEDVGLLAVKSLVFD